MKLKITTLALLAAICCSFVSAQSPVKNKRIENGEWQINPSLVSKQASSDMEMIEMSPKFLRVSAPMMVENAEVTAFSTRELRAPAATDSTLYFRPQGFFFAGLTPKYISATSSFNILFGPSNVPVTWRNLSSYPSTAYSWKLPDPNSTTAGAYITSTEARPTQTFLFGMYDVIPTLTSTAANNTKEVYKWGEQAAVNDRLITGATITHMLDGGIEVPACNYDAQQLYEPFAFQATNPPAEGYLFGRRTDGLVDAVGNFFEKPLHPYTIDRVWVHAIECKAPAGTEFELIIHKVTYDENNKLHLTDTLATSKTTIEQVDGPLNQGLHYTLMFDRLMVFDEEFGLEMETAYIVVEDEILVELKGFNKEGIEFGVLGQTNHTAGRDHNAAIFVEDAQKGRQLSAYSHFSTNLYFNLDVTYSFLFADSDVFEAPQAGGSKDFDISCLYATGGIGEFNPDMPAWITSTFLRPSSDGGTSYTITVAELPANIPYREYTIWLYTKGADFPIKITQGTSSSVGNIMEHQVNVVSTANEFQLTYPVATFNKVSLWNATGAFVAEYALSQDGKFAIPTGSLPQGTYILRLTGAANKSIKVVK